MIIKPQKPLTLSRDSANRINERRKSKDWVGFSLYRVIHPNWWEVLSYNFENKWVYKKIKVSHCSKFMNVYLFTTKIPKGATIGMHVHIAFYVEIYDKTPNDFDEKKIMQTFCIIACPRSIKMSISIWPLESSWNCL